MNRSTFSRGFLGLALGAAVLLAGAPSGARAQASGSAGAVDTVSMTPLPPAGVADRSGLEAFVLGGTLSPLALLSSDPGSFALQVSSAPMVGGTVGWWMTSGLGAGVQVLYAPATLNIVPTSFQGPIPTDLGNVRYLAATAEVRYRLVLHGPAGVLAPYAALGAGVRHLSFDPIASLDARDTTDPVGTVAVGTEAGLYGPVAMRIELRDYLSRYSSPTTGATRTQHDIVITFGLGILP